MAKKKITHRARKMNQTSKANTRKGASTGIQGPKRLINALRAAQEKLASAMSHFDMGETAVATKKTSTKAAAKRGGKRKTSQSQGDSPANG